MHGHRQRWLHFQLFDPHLPFLNQILRPLNDFNSELSGNSRKEKKIVKCLAQRNLKTCVVSWTLSTIELPVIFSLVLPQQFLAIGSRQVNAEGKIAFRLPISPHTHAIPVHSLWITLGFPPPALLFNGPFVRMASSVWGLEETCALHGVCLSSPPNQHAISGPFEGCE